MFYLATLGIQAAYKIDLTNILGMHYFGSHLFKPYQIISYMFMHANFGHIFFNMFALWMFGSVLENYWGPKRFFSYYMITGIGAIMVQMVVTYIQIMNVMPFLSPEQIEMVKTEGYKILAENKNYIDVYEGKLNLLYNTGTLGASGAVFGLLLAFGMTFPNSVIYLYFAIPIKAKWFVILYAALELYSGLSNNPSDNVAHFAHLGGALVGLIIILFWNRKTKNKLL